MSRAPQQPVSVQVYGGTGQQQPMVIQTVTQPQVVPVPVSRGEKLHCGDAHKVLGIIQMTIGCICLCFSILGFMVGSGGVFYHYFGSGIYSGIFFVIPGFLGFMAYKRNSQCCVVGCMVMNIIGSCVALLGLSFVSVEFTTNAFITENRKTEFQHAKRSIVLTGCVLEFFITIIHSSFTCATCCACCWPRQPVPVAPPVTGAVVIHQVPQTNVMYPGQVYAPYQGALPQQQQIISQQPLPAGQYQVPVVQNYPQQQQYYHPPQYGQGSGNPADLMNPPAYNPSYNQSSSHDVVPPPYSEYPSEKQ